MGQSKSSSRYGNTYVQTEKPYYFSGELVRGTVYLNIIEPFPGQYINLKIKGKEESWWQTDSDRRERRNSFIHINSGHSGSSFFYSHCITLHYFQGRLLAPGQFAFPFYFYLQNYLPGSFYYDTDDAKGSIKYKLKSEITSFDSHEKIKHTQELLIREPQQDLLQPLFGQSECRIKTWCCFNQGYSNLKCVIDKNNYLPGEDAVVWVDLNNSNCKKAIDKITFKLTQFIVLKSSGGYNQSIQHQVTKSEIQGIGANQQAIDDQRKILVMKLARTNEHSNYHQLGSLQPTAKGKFVQNFYELSINLDYDGCTCCSNTPNVVLPVSILAPLPQQEIIQQPIGWNPVTFEPKLITFSDQNVYAKNPDDQYKTQNINQNNNVAKMAPLMQGQQSMQYQQVNYQQS